MKFLLTTLSALSLLTVTFAQDREPVPGVGIVQSLTNDSLVSAAGYHYIVESVSAVFSPKKIPDEQFHANLDRIHKLRSDLYAVNIFIPGELKVVGPEIDEPAILDYADKVFQRLREAKVKLLIWGSGGSRRVPDGFDRLKARQQFVGIARKVAEVAKKYQIVVALENLNSTETNFINTVEEAYQIVREVDHPNLRLCADVYHMLMEKEAPGVVEKTARYLVHCDLAERENRAPPGTHGEDFREYLRVLKKVGYHGKIVLECRWENLATQAAPALKYIQAQIDEVWK